MGPTVKIALAGIERQVPLALLDSYKSIGWKVLGADPVVKSEKPKTSQTSSRKKKATEK